MARKESRERRRMTAATAADGPTAYPDRAGRFEIRTPNADFRGVRHNVQFIDGVGRTDDATRAAACRELGYEVTELPTGDPGPGQHERTGPNARDHIS